MCAIRNRMLKPTIFREYDIRGVADTELLSPDVVDLGRGLGTLLQRKSGRSITLGRDCRLSSPRLRDALLEGLIDSGCEVTDIGVVPTPLLYFSAVHLGADGAVMITGSHNPSEFNGFKTVCAGPLHCTEKLSRRSDRSSKPAISSKATAARPPWTLFRPIWTRSLRNSTIRDASKSSWMPVTGPPDPWCICLFERLNCEVTELFFDMDGRFPNHHPDPTVPANLKHLQDAVKAQKAELGIAFDGDSDRIGAVDENGEVIYGDMLLLIFGREILTRKPGATIIGEVKCSQLLYDELNRLGGNAIMYKTGHSLIKAKMKQEHAELAGEMSGHMFFADRYLGYDDALYAACRLIEIVARSGQPLSGQLAGLPQLVSTPEIRVDCPDEVKFQVVERVTERLKKTHNVIDVDGVRVRFEHGWGLVRASNTQPVLVMRFEAENADWLAKYRGEMESALEEAKAAVA